MLRNKLHTILQSCIYCRIMKVTEGKLLKIQLYWNATPCSLVQGRWLSTNRNSSIFGVKKSWLLNPNLKNKKLRSFNRVSNLLPIDTAEHPCRIEPSTTPLWEPPISHDGYKLQNGIATTDR
jgi:hypothetical protein